MKHSGLGASLPGLEFQIYHLVTEELDSFQALVSTTCGMRATAPVSSSQGVVRIMSAHDVKQTDSASDSKSSNRKFFSLTNTSADILSGAKHI